VKRKPNIELLRILAILGVIVLHYKNEAMLYVSTGSIHYYLLMVLESLFVCAVDLFMLISGYFLAATEKRSLWKPMQLVIQVMLFQMIEYAIRSFLQGAFSLKTFIGSAVPANYFVILYCAVYLISPFINMLLKTLSSKSSQQFLLLWLLLFAAYPTLMDAFCVATHNEWMGLSTIGVLGNQWGYTIVTFALMYAIGAALRLEIFTLQQWNSKRIIVLLLACVGILTAWAGVFLAIWEASGSAWHYENPFVIFMAILAFELFSRIRIRSSLVGTSVNHVSKGVFSVYLLHAYFLKHIGIERFAIASPVILLMHIVASALIIYLLCLAVHLLYHKVTDPIFRYLQQKFPLSLTSPTTARAGTQP